MITIVKKPKKAYIGLKISVLKSELKALEEDRKFLEIEIWLREHGLIGEGYV